MLDEESGIFHVLETIFANVESFGLGVGCREGRVVPRLYFVFAHAYFGNVFDFGDFVMFGFEFGEVRVEVSSASSDGVGVVVVGFGGMSEWISIGYFGGMTTVSFAWFSAACVSFSGSVGCGMFVRCILCVGGASFEC
jgi:hypothetical protein